MEQNSNGGEQISLALAKELTSEFRKQFPNAVKANLISADNMMKILEQPGCKGIRIYNGLNTSTGNITPVIVATDINGNDLSHGVIMDKLKPCPTDCDNSSELCN